MAVYFIIIDSSCWLQGCDRSPCKFLHLTRREEDRFNETGELPRHRGRPESARGRDRDNGYGIGGGRGFNGPPPPMGGGGGVPPPCKDFLNNKCDRGRSCKFRHATEREMALEVQLFERDHHHRGRDMAPSPVYGKRRRMEDDGTMEENEMLKRKITDLQKQVLDLREMNDTLYEQNNKYRTQLRM